MRPRGVITRGTTAHNRLRRLDRWLKPPNHPQPLVVDLGFGADPVTTVEWYDRLWKQRGAVRVIGLEIDPQRVAYAQSATIPGKREFRLGGFELAGLKPHLVRAMNVLRQYPESEVAQVWRLIADNLAPDGRFIDGTSSELGRVASWISHDTRRPVTLTFAVDLRTMTTPAVLAERLPKALIHRNIPGEPVHELLTALESAWRHCAPYRAFGPRDRWRRSLDTLAEAGWPVRETPARRRDGTLTVTWSAVAPRSGPMSETAG